MPFENKLYLKKWDVKRRFADANIKIKYAYHSKWCKYDVNLVFDEQKQNQALIINFSNVLNVFHEHVSEL